MKEFRDSLPVGMVQEKATILLHRRIAPDHYRMRLESRRAARRARPGQFVHVRCLSEPDRWDGKEPRLPRYAGFPWMKTSRKRRGIPGQESETGRKPLLRRPFSLFDADPSRGTVDFIYKVIGAGTAALARGKVGERVDFLGPLGRPFQIPSPLDSSSHHPTGQAWLVGGGVGIPPLYFLAKWLKDAPSPHPPPPTPSRGNENSLQGGGRKGGGAGKGEGVEIKVFLGARTKAWILCASAFRQLGLSVEVATDDGTLGHRGTAVDLLKRFLPSTIHHPPPTMLYLCGPTPMMAAAAALARRLRIPAQVSLEERMGCAMGVCMGCVVEIRDEPPDSHARFQRVCTEGPVFPAEAIRWQLH